MKNKAFFKLNRIREIYVRESSVEKTITSLKQCSSGRSTAVNSSKSPA